MDKIIRFQVYTRLDRNGAYDPEGVRELAVMATSISAIRQPLTARAEEDTRESGDTVAHLTVGDETWALQESYDRALVRWSVTLDVAGADAAVERTNRAKVNEPESECAMCRAKESDSHNVDLQTYQLPAYSYDPDRDHVERDRAGVYPIPTATVLCDTCAWDLAEMLSTEIEREER